MALTTTDNDGNHSRKEKRKSSPNSTVVPLNPSFRAVYSIICIPWNFIVYSHKGTNIETMAPVTSSGLLTGLWKIGGVSLDDMSGISSSFEQTTEFQYRGN